MATTQAASEGSMAARLGLNSGDVVQEFGYDEDVDQALRQEIEKVTGEALLDEGAQEVVDAVLYWWRADDGDLVDCLMDALTNLDEAGKLWLFTPKSGRDGHVPPADVEEAAPTAGLHAGNTVSICADWTATRLNSPKANHR